MPLVRAREEQRVRLLLHKLLNGLEIAIRPMKYESVCVFVYLAGGMGASVGSRWERNGTSLHTCQSSPEFAREIPFQESV